MDSKEYLEKELDDYIRRNHYRLINSVLLFKDDQFMVERYHNGFTERSRNHIKSVWKSILALGIGICLDKGLIGSLEDPISKYLQEFDGRGDPRHRLIRIRDILSMSSGIYWNGGVHYHCPMVTQCFRSGNIREYISDIQMSHASGTVFQYKEWDALLASMVLAQASGRNPFDFCREYLYGPLEIESGRWFTFPDGVCYTIPGNALHGVDGEAEEAKSDLSARDMAKLGILFLQQGVFNGKRIVSEGYLKQVVTSSAAEPEYGLFVWLGDGWYGFRGYGGQEVTVIPDRNLVFVIQATPTASAKSYGDVLPFLLEKMDDYVPVPDQEVVT